jgi:hypothetical protein
MKLDVFRGTIEVLNNLVHQFSLIGLPQINYSTYLCGAPLHTRNICFVSMENYRHTKTTIVTNV